MLETLTKSWTLKWIKGHGWEVASTGEMDCGHWGRLPQFPSAWGRSSACFHLRRMAVNARHHVPVIYGGNGLVHPTALYIKFLNEFYLTKPFLSVLFSKFLPVQRNCTSTKISVGDSFISLVSYSSNCLKESRFHSMSHLSLLDVSRQTVRAWLWAVSILGCLLAEQMADFQALVPWDFLLWVSVWPLRLYVPSYRKEQALSDVLKDSWGWEKPHGK